MSKRLRRWDMVDVFLYLLLAAMVVGLLQGVIAFAGIVIEDPLFVAGYLALVGVLAVPYRLAARAWQARPPVVPGGGGPGSGRPGCRRTSPTGFSWPPAGCSSAAGAP